MMLIFTIQPKFFQLIRTDLQAQKQDFFRYMWFKTNRAHYFWSGQIMVYSVIIFLTVLF